MKPEADTKKHLPRNSSERTLSIQENGDCDISEKDDLNSLERLKRAAIYSLASLSHQCESWMAVDDILSTSLADIGSIATSAISDDDGDLNFAALKCLIHNTPELISKLTEANRACMIVADMIKAVRAS